MNLQNIFNQIESNDPEFYERTSPRRAAIRTFMKGAAMTAVPFALGGLLKKAYGQSTGDVVHVLNYALTLEYLEAQFYSTALNNATALNLNGAPLGAIQTISKHETAHVAFLKTAIDAVQSGAAVSSPRFDYSGGMGSMNGPFASVFSSYDVFLAVAQTFEDTGVRAYKGQAPSILDDKYNDVLTAALQIHSVEARHAAHIRYMRSNRQSSTNVGTIRPWITQDQSNITTGNASADAAIQKSYAGENMSTQAGVDVASFIGADYATQSFDEPLTEAQVLDIVKPFIIP